MSAALLAGCPKAPRYGADEPDADVVTDALGLAPADAGPTPDLPAIDRPSPDVAAPQDVPRDAGPPMPTDVAHACPAPLQRCGSVCRDLSTDPAHCGRCDNACASGTACAGGACRCPAGQTVCAGACRDLRRDNAHCGRCDNACAAGTICADGDCDTTCARGTAACDGVCRDLQNDPGHCGRCGRGCSFAHGVGGCRRGSCALAACDAGFADCDGRDESGCETATTTDPANCGVCGNRCQFAHASASCAGGRCAMGACAAGYRDCDGDPRNGCEANVAWGDVANCGACGRRCPAAPVGVTAVCAMGACGLSSLSCPSERRDCNGSVSDGCEVQVQGDVANCGACGNRCASAGGTPGCSAGVCRIACAAGLGDCDGNAANGCETDTATSAAHCGACGRACVVPNAQAGCAGGGCVVARCNEAYGDCDGSAANGCERNLGSDNLHCGACGVPCPAGRVCSGGVCQLSCGTLAVCDGACRDTRVDPDHCGACGRACSAAGMAVRSCAAGQCNGACAPGRADCNNDLRADGCETDTGSSLASCGGCGMTCSTAHVTPACAGGACAGACEAGYADCNMNKRADGCETAVAVDANNCGGCGARCPARPNASPRCAAGVCAFACAEGFADCDRVESNGCEVDLASDAHCGACGAACAMGQRCVRGDAGAPRCGM